MKPGILYITDLYYPAKGRNYYEEDLQITGYLRNEFQIAVCNPRDTAPFEDSADLIVFRNAGPVIEFQKEYDDFVGRVRKEKLQTFNEFTGKADMAGKQYLVDLTKAGFPVTPTVDSLDDMAVLPETDSYVIKPKIGADSIGLEFLSGDELPKRGLPEDGSMLIQPALDFQYEVSFYFINDIFEYALYAPDKAKRWQLANYKASNEDIRYAEKFIRWNSISHGIQRVDACRMKDGRLLLIELEDLDPYLSIDLLTEGQRERFLSDFAAALHECI